MITLLATAGTKIHTISSVGVNADITAALTLTAGTRWDFAQAPAAASQGPVYAVNGTDAPIKWTGSGNAAAWTKSGSGEPPIGGSSSDHPQFIAAWEDRVYLARSANNRSRIWWRRRQPERVADRERHGAGPKRRRGDHGHGARRPLPAGVQAHQDLPDLRLRLEREPRAVRVGWCIANRSIVETPMGTMWLSLGEGIVVTNGQTVKTISKKIQSVERWIKFQKKSDARIDHIFSQKIQERKPDFSMEKFRSKTDHDFILSAEEALDFNLIDRIIGDNGDIRRRE